MDKFSLYDFLGILLPGLLFLFLLGQFNNIWDVAPTDYFTLISEFDWGTLGASICFGFIFGMALYILNFELVKKKWFNQLTGMYTPVAILYQKMGSFHPVLNEVLNTQAQKWYKRNIFLSIEEFEKLNTEERDEIIRWQDEYFDRAYYELEYLEKISVPKSFQSFYFFFRQIATGCIILVAIAIPYTLIYKIVNCHMDIVSFFHTVNYVLILSVLTLMSIWMARWNRKRMVLKLYYTYFSHLNQK